MRVAAGTVDPRPVFSDELTYDDAPAALGELLDKPIVLRASGCAGTASGD